MKFQFIPLVAFFGATLTDAYMYSSGPGRAGCRPSQSSCRNDRDSFASSVRADRLRQRQEVIDQAFRDLQSEMRDSRRRGRRRNKNPDRVVDFMMMDPFSMEFQEVDNEAVKKWVGKAFDLASDFNQDFSQTSEEREANDEFLQKSRKWVETVYEKPDTPNTEKDQGEEVVSEVSEVTDNQDEASTSSSDEPMDEPIIITPYSENKSDEETFRVTVDLPGVDRSDVDLALEGDSLTVEAERRPSEDGSSVLPRKYKKKFALLEDEIEVERIEASLKDGVLTVSAPKKVKEEKETKIKIPLV